MWERCLTMFSAGKTFSMTGIRMGWLIGKEDLITMANKVHMATMFCTYEPLQHALAESLNTINSQPSPNYYNWLAA